ncbi:endolytic transglycosylase MltG [Nocardiopsis potens]|uniref:endolytic transglycosylase MltG n=1 Tax=Nocardiopsis potens TaxID=1246458 RepID=UPI0003474D89|nr:endolytic transglycosylase MltG [Nocardiopsis potens]
MNGDEQDDHYGGRRYRGRRERLEPRPEAGPADGPLAGPAPAADPLTDPWPSGRRGSRHRAAGTEPRPADPLTDPWSAPGADTGARRYTDTGAQPRTDTGGHRYADTGAQPRTGAGGHRHSGAAPSGTDPSGAAPRRGRRRKPETDPDAREAPRPAAPEEEERRPRGRRHRRAADEDDPLGFGALRDSGDHPDPFEEPVRHRPLDFDAVPVRRRQNRAEPDRGEEPPRRGRRRAGPAQAEEPAAEEAGSRAGRRAAPERPEAEEEPPRRRRRRRAAGDAEAAPEGPYPAAPEEEHPEPEEAPRRRRRRSEEPEEAEPAAEEPAPRRRRRRRSGPDRAEEPEAEEAAAAAAAPEPPDDEDGGEDRPRRGRRASGRRSAGRGRKRGGRRTTLIAAGAALLVVVAAGGFVTRSYLFPADYDGAGSGEVEVVVPDGATGSQIGDILEEAGVVASSRAFVNALDADAHPSPGTYLMRSEMSADAAVGLLLDPEARIGVKVTIKEGERSDAILAQLSEQVGIPLEELEAAYEDTEALKLPEYAEEGAEGYLFPDTYTFSPDDTAEEVLGMMVRRYDQAAEDPEIDLEKRADEVGLEPDEVMSVAAIVQAETGSVEDMPKIAAVVYNRLDEGMELGMDSTCFYVIGEHGIALTNDQLAECKAAESDYATYGRTGLPAGPIVSPGEDAMKAALNPADGDWLYFVATDPEQGTTEFAETYDEFLVLKERFQNNWQGG